MVGTIIKFFPKWPQRECFIKNFAFGSLRCRRCPNHRECRLMFTVGLCCTGMVLLGLGFILYKPITRFL